MLCQQQSTQQAYAGMVRDEVGAPAEESCTIATGSCMLLCCTHLRKSEGYFLYAGTWDNGNPVNTRKPSTSTEWLINVVGFSDNRAITADDSSKVQCRLAP
jgi:hypothetical protein